METCQIKHAPQDPTQTQLSRYGSGPSGAAAEQHLTFSEDERLINFLQRYVQP